MRNLEEDLIDSEVIRSKVLDMEYATRLYSALCNIKWFTETPDEAWTCSWRYAGGMVADLRDVGEDYLHFYCSGSEGHVDPEVEKDLGDLGWRWTDY